MLYQLRALWKFRAAVAYAAHAIAQSNPGDRDIVVLPCWQRPEFLWHCLLNLTRADDFGSVHVLFRLDTGFSAENLEVIDAFSGQLGSYEVQSADPCPFRRTKQSANVLLGYLNAARSTSRMVYLIEEDIMVARDFFRWHRAVNAREPDIFCSIAVKNHNRKVAVPADVSGYYRTTGDYCSHGVCMDRLVVERLIAPHVNMHYFRKPKRYLRRHFPSSAVPLGFVEQDGLIRRIQEASHRPTVYPCVPRAFHAGFYGYNRAGGVGGSLSEKVRQLETIIYDVDTLCAANQDSSSGADSVPVPLDVPAWDALSDLTRSCGT